MLIKLKKFIKDKNFSTKIIVFLFALFIWIFIYNYNDPIVTQPYTLNVNLLNEDKLEAASKVYSITQGKTVSIRIKAKQSFFDSINKEDITASADLSNLSEVNATSINIAIANTDKKDWEVTSYSPELLKVSLDEYVHEQYPIEIISTGELTDNKYLKDYSCSPSMVTISGPKSIMDNIHSVYVEPNLTNAEEGYNTNCNIIIKDKDGNIITDNYSFDTDKIKVSANILSKKEIPLNVTVIDNVPSGYEILNTSYEPETVTIAGSEQIINDLDEININYTVNQIDNIEKVLNIEDYISNDLIILDNKEITFKAEIAAFSTKQIEFNKNDIKVENIKDNVSLYKLSLIDTYFEITGPTEELEKINKNNFSISIDAENLNVGEIDVTCTVLPNEEFERIQVVSAPNAQITFRKK